MTPARPSLAPAAAIAAHRFGLGEGDLRVVGDDARGWLLAQLGPADPAQGDGLVDSAEALRRQATARAERRASRATDGAPLPAGASGAPLPLPVVAEAPGARDNALRDAVQADLRARVLTAATTRRPFVERLVLFWANHFTVSTLRAGVRGLAGAFEREALRPHLHGRFETLLAAATRHAAMLRYLDNDRSAGSDSPRALARRAGARAALADDGAGDGTPPVPAAGMNENLARELLELHTLGVDGGYAQADVVALAAVLTGWRSAPAFAVAGRGLDTVRFDPAWHQPGPKTVLGRRYGTGPRALEAVLHDLARHPSTARFLALKLARHFVADDPPPALVARLEAAYRASDGELDAVYRALIGSEEAWAPAPTKLRSPEEFVIATLRLLPPATWPPPRQLAQAARQLGQPVQAAPSPAGWPDRADEWLGPDAVWKRVEWAVRVAERAGRQVDARALALAALGPWLHGDTRRQIERAADGPQALTLLLLAPEFQRR